MTIILKSGPGRSLRFMNIILGPPFCLERLTLAKLPRFEYRITLSFPVLLM